MTDPLVLGGLVHDEVHLARAIDGYVDPSRANPASAAMLARTVKAQLDRLHAMANVAGVPPEQLLAVGMFWLAAHPCIVTIRWNAVILTTGNCAGARVGILSMCLPAPPWPAGRA